MSSKQTVIIKDYHNGGGDLKFEVNISTISERVIAGEKIIKLKVARTPDKNSTRLGMFAFLRNSQPGYKSLGFSEVTLIFDRHAENGKFLSRTFIVFSQVGVERSEKKGDDEEITFIASQKSEEFTIAGNLTAP